MKHIFNDFMARLQTAVPEVKWIDEDAGQLEGFYERPPVLFPCVLIDFDDVDYEDLGDGMQRADGFAKFRIAFNPVHHTNNVTPTPIKSKALERFDLVDKIAAAFHGWEGEKFTTLSRTKRVSEKRTDNLKVYLVSFRFAWEETIEKIEQTTQRPAPNINN